MKKMQIQLLSVGDINPFIRIIRRHTLEPGFRSGLRYNLHYQLHYILNGMGYFYIEGTKYNAKKGDLCIWGPGQAHLIATSNDVSMEVIGVQFDFTRNFAHNNELPISYNKDNFKPEEIYEKVEFTDFKGFSPYRHIKNEIVAKQILKSSEQDYLYGGKYREEKASQKLKGFFILLAEEELLQKKMGKLAANKAEIIAYIEKHYTKNITNQNLANEFGYHPVHLNRLVHDLVGRSLHQYIIQLRINEALHLLQNTSLLISQVAEAVGYNDPQYFSKLFKVKTGYPPSYLRKGNNPKEE